MKGLTNSAIWAAGTLLLTGFLALAQGPGAGKGTRMYDPSTETTLNGTIDEVKQGTRGAMMGMHLVIKGEQQSIEVMLGPSNFISSKGFSFAKGDSVRVAGSKVKVDGTEYIIAREVVKDGKTLVLRDKDGRPQWAGSGKGRSAQPK